MRDRWFEKMNLGRRPLDERGMLLTLYAWGDAFDAAECDVHMVMGEGWEDVARRLAEAGLVEIQRERGWVRMRIRWPDGDRRKANRHAQRKRRKNRSKTLKGDRNHEEED